MALPDIPPDGKGWTFFDGPDPATASEYVVTTLRKLQAGQLYDDAAEIVEEAAEEFFVPYVFRQVGGAYDPPLQASVSMASGGISFSATDDSLNWPGGDFVAAGFTAGGYFMVINAAKPNNNGWAKGVTVSATKITVSKSLENEAAGRRIGLTIATDYEVNGLITDWERKYWNGTTILPTDLMVMVPLTDGSSPLAFVGVRA
jgi:hypothetical protein